MVGVVVVGVVVSGRGDSVVDVGQTPVPRTPKAAPVPRTPTRTPATTLFRTMESANENRSARPTESRVGRSHQRYNPVSGARMVAGCICLDETKDKVVMILSSAHKGKWVLPKGGIETDEGDDYSVSAVRETWEEAGCEGRIVAKLPVVYDMRGPKAPVLSREERRQEFDPAKVVPRLEFHFYEMLVTNMSSTWPEPERERRWCTYAEAKHELEKAKRPELVAALESLSIVKNEGPEY